ncbi:MAG TPA: T9SS type A sorting domain-containing protein [Bacteroidia bacterium]|nr:T9SS type A sorting domain-containing protein [Bacteroidia bacterium]
MKKIVCILLLGFLLPSLGSYAQSSLTFTPHSISHLQDTVQEQSTVTDTVTLYNNGPAAFSGVISFSTGLDSLPGGPGQNIIDTAAVFTNIPVNSSASFGITRTYLTPNTSPPGRFRTGNNVIVVWPVYRTGSGTTIDTVKGTVFVYKKEKPHKISFDGLFDLYPNPSFSSITIVPKTGFLLSATLIYGMDGTLVRTLGSETRVCLSDLPKGMYLIELLFQDGSVGRQKLVLQ